MENRAISSGDGESACCASRTVRKVTKVPSDGSRLSAVRRWARVRCIVVVVLSVAIYWLNGMQ